MNLERIFLGKDFNVPDEIEKVYHYNYSLLTAYYGQKYHLITLLRHDEEREKYFVQFEGLIWGRDHLCWTEVSKDIFNDIIEYWSSIGKEAVFIQCKEEFGEHKQNDAIYEIKDVEITLSHSKLDPVNIYYPSQKIYLTVPYIYCDSPEIDVLEHVRYSV